MTFTFQLHQLLGYKHNHRRIHIQKWMTYKFCRTFFHRLVCIHEQISKIIHEKRLTDLPMLCEKLKDSHVIIYADAQAYQALEGRYPAELLEHAKAESFGTEFLDYKMAVKTVKSFEDALGHIQENSSKHSECIVTENKERAALFTKIVDAACVYTNVSTAFTDGAQFGLGAEIGISTQKLHARGPMGLEEITSYKWVIEGDGQTRRNWDDTVIVKNQTRYWTKLIEN